jgi:formamidopyrimidine-DNA glycosylase
MLAESADNMNSLPELPDVTVYIEALSSRILGQRVERARVGSPFLVRTVAPPLAAIEGRTVTGLQRVGKRIAIGVEGGAWMVIHLMIAGRLHWHPAPKRPKTDGRRTLAAFDFAEGSVSLSEAGTKKRASIHMIQGDAGLAQLDPGGIDVLSSSLADFTARLTLRNHTLKRALTDPRLLSGIGNAYSDEILHRARLSPIKQTQKMSEEEMLRLHEATKLVLQDWIARLREDAGKGFPEKVTAFREGMAVHGRYGEPCPDCGEKIQRIRYADNETNYCAHCQTNGKLLADRGLSRLLGADWPKTLAELEELTSRAGPGQP